MNSKGIILFQRKECPESDMHIAQWHTGFQFVYLITMKSFLVLIGGSGGDGTPQ